MTLALAGAQTFAAPFPTVDQNPLLNGFTFATNLPARLPARGSATFTTTVNWSNSAAIQTADDEMLIIDAESREWRLGFAYALADNWSVRVQVPYRSSNAGTLDGFVDNWHALLGLPNGDRSALPKNDFRIEYERAGEIAASYLNEVSGVGDIVATAAYQLGATPNHATSLALTLKAPTGSSEKLTGSGGTDVVLSLAHEQVLSSRWVAFAQVNAAYLSTGDLLADQQRNSIASGMLAFDYRYSPAVTITLQLDGHTPAFTDSQLDLLGSAWILTVGGEYRWRSGWRAQIGIGEDVKVEASPDVNFVFTVAKEWK